MALYPAEEAGRPKAGEGEPPMPKMWKPVERLAGVLAYLEVSEAGPNANLETDAKAAYPAQLDFVCTELCSDGFTMTLFPQARAAEI